MGPIVGLRPVPTNVYQNRLVIVITLLVHQVVGRAVKVRSQLSRNVADVSVCSLRMGEGFSEVCHLTSSITIEILVKRQTSSKLE